MAKGYVCHFYLYLIHHYPIALCFIRHIKEPVNYANGQMHGGWLEQWLAYLIMGRPKSGLQRVCSGVLLHAEKIHMSKVLKLGREWPSLSGLSVSLRL